MEILVVPTQQDLINFCFEPQWLQNPTDFIENLCGSAILCPTNSVVQDINEEILNNMQGDEQVFNGIDTVVSDKEIDDFNGELNEHSIEAMNRIETAGMPPHVLKLKFLISITIAPFLSVFTGLCNGTRMQVLKADNSLLKCKVLSGSRSQNGEIVFLPLCKFEYGNVKSEPGVHFTRTQFPVKLSFAISINKAQGQTLSRVGLNFRQGECFSHGQLYTAMSRVRTKDSLKIFPSTKANTCTNVVWHRLLDKN
uniref:ATP-dependent DNA helicase n=1 Tax=Panagrolaimus sp. ES5 TaxID=591445 RepID=A0AC34FZX9_9BILA